MPSSDITFCTGEVTYELSGGVTHVIKCPLRDNCYRYKDNIPATHRAYVSMMYPPESLVLLNYCEYYYEKQKN